MHVAMHRHFPAIVVAGIVVMAACVAAVAQDKPKPKPKIDRIEMFTTPRGAIVTAKERVEHPNVDDPDVIVLSRTYYPADPTELNYIDEQCEGCASRKTEAARLETQRRDLSRMMIALVFVVMIVGTICLIVPPPEKR